MRAGGLPARLKDNHRLASSLSAPPCSPTYVEGYDVWHPVQAGLPWSPRLYAGNRYPGRASGRRVHFAGGFGWFSVGLRLRLLQLFGAGGTTQRMSNIPKETVCQRSG